MDTQTRRRSSASEEGGSAVSSLPYRIARDLENFRDLCQSLRLGVYKVNGEGDFLDANLEFLEMIGLSSFHDLRSCNATRLLRWDPDLNADRLVHEFQLSNRTFLNITSPVQDRGTEEVYYHGLLIDISETCRAERVLEEGNLRDSLTGAYTKQYLEEFDAETWGCIYIYIDHFRQYIQRYGQPAWEYALARMSRFLMRFLRISDAIVRMSEEEFLVLLPDVNDSIMNRVARRLRTTALGQAPMGFSLGCARRLENESLEQTILRANRDLSPVHVLLRTPKTERR